MEITAKVEGGKLIITATLASTPELSKSGKSLVLASTQGNVKFATATYKGQPITVGLNAYVPAH